MRATPSSVRSSTPAPTVTRDDVGPRLAERVAQVVDALPLGPGMRVLEDRGAPGAAARAVDVNVWPSICVGLAEVQVDTGTSCRLAAIVRRTP